MAAQDLTDPAVELCRKAVDLMLSLGDWVPYEISDSTEQLDWPPAGQIISTELIEAMCVAPRAESLNAHVVMRLSCNGFDLEGLSCNGLDLEAHCLVTSYDGRIDLVQAFACLDGKYVMHRNFTVESDGSLELWKPVPTNDALVAACEGVLEPEMLAGLREDCPDPDDFFTAVTEELAEAGVKHIKVFLESRGIAV